MDLAFCSNKKSKWPKNGSKRISLKNAKWRRSDAKGKETSPDSTRSPKTEFFIHF